MKIKNSQKNTEIISKERAVKSIFHMIECIEFRIFFISLLPFSESYYYSKRILLVRLRRIKQTVERLDSYLKSCEEIPTSTQKKSVKDRLSRLETTLKDTSKSGIAIVYGRPEILTPYLEPCYGYIGIDVHAKKKKKKRS